MTNIFESKHYPEVMYLLILITIIAITFNLANMINDSAANKSIKFTGYAVSDNQKNAINTTQLNNTNASEAKQQEIYSENSYGIYYLILIAIGIMISLVLVTFILPKIKHLT